MMLRIGTVLLILCLVGCEDDSSVVGPAASDPPLTLSVSGRSFSTGDTLELTLQNNLAESIEFIALCGTMIQARRDAQWDQVYAPNCDAVFETPSALEAGESLTLTRTVPALDFTPDELARYYRYAYRIQTAESHRVLQVATVPLEIKFTSPSEGAVPR